MSLKKLLVQRKVDRLGVIIYTYSWPISFNPKFEGNLYMAVHVPSLNIYVGGAPENGVVSVSLKEKMKKFKI